MAAQATEMLFSKKLTDTDVKKRLAIPAETLLFLPVFSESSHAININLVYGTRKWPIVCTIRKKPVFSGRLWRDFVICNNLNVGARISMHKVQDEDGSSSHYRVELEKPCSKEDETTAPCRRKVCNNKQKQPPIKQDEIKCFASTNYTESLDLVLRQPTPYEETETPLSAHTKTMVRSTVRFRP
ncbi:hypothetical protein HRI_004033200 [Hibiscus trionum]|uniref:TF-B3 domain-containing protein n=1 Tax=Hibiscus trionum TaxID=183268 RepID=A0A9W7ML62_HIBTR|nr:hypothetical protein HRI_004033200 [Hibiscus trionum]